MYVCSVLFVHHILPAVQEASEDGTTFSVASSTDAEEGEDLVKYHFGCVLLWSTFVQQSQVPDQYQVLDWN